MAMKFLLVLLFSSVTAGYSPQQSASGKVIGGTIATEGQVPWMVSIQRKNDSGQFCGGSIIGQNWIVTAAQCTQIDMNEYQVRAGSLTYDTGGSVHDIVVIIVHENYNYNTLENDIAVWLVLQSFNDDLTKKPIGLPTQNANSIDHIAVSVAGWGATKYGGEPSKDLMKTDTEIIGKNTCNEKYSNFGGIPNNQICAGDLIFGQEDSCQFDTGGPLYIDDATSPELRGIVSWGYGCGLVEFPGVYTEVSRYRDWIKQQTGL